LTALAKDAALGPIRGEEWVYCTVYRDLVDEPVSMKDKSVILNSDRIFGNGDTSCKITRDGLF